MYVFVPNTTGTSHPQLPYALLLVVIVEANVTLHLVAKLSNTLPGDTEAEVRVRILPFQVYLKWPGSINESRLQVPGANQLSPETA